MTVQGEVAENIEAAAVIVRTEMARQLTSEAAAEVRDAAKAAIDMHYEHVMVKHKFSGDEEPAETIVEETPPPEDALDEGGGEE